MAILAHMFLQADGATVIILNGETFESKQKIKEIDGFHWVKGCSEPPFFSHWEKICFDSESLMTTITALSAMGVTVFITGECYGECYEDFDGEILALMRKKEGR